VTDGGLDRFREFAVSAVSTNQGLSNDRVISVLAGNDGAVWIGTFEGLNRWKDGSLRQVTGPGLPEHGVQYLHEDRRGRLWIATSTRGGYLETQRFLPVYPPPRLMNTFGIAEDAHGVIWVAIRELGILAIQPDGAVRQTPLAALGHGDDWPNVLMADRNGGVWIGFNAGGIAYMVDGHVR